MLKVNHLYVNYGTVKAIEDISFLVNENEIVAMIGPNGAGKSTALRAISGLLQVTGGEIKEGEINFMGESIKGLRTDELVKKGLSLVPEGRRVFPTMTVLENLEMGAFTIKKLPVADDRLPERLNKVFELFPDLRNRKKQKAGTLSSGEQQMLALGRALMLKPKLLLADEPSLGLSPNYVDLIFDKLVEINKSGTSILLVEQNARMALDISHRAYVFEIGKIFKKGKRKDLINDIEVQKSFLGVI